MIVSIFTNRTLSIFCFQNYRKKAGEVKLKKFPYTGHVWKKEGGTPPE